MVLLISSTERKDGKKPFEAAVFGAGDEEVLKMSSMLSVCRQLSYYP